MLCKLVAADCLLLTAVIAKIGFGTLALGEDYSPLLYRVDLKFTFSEELSSKFYFNIETLDNVLATLI